MDLYKSKTVPFAFAEQPDVDSIFSELEKS